MHKFVIEGGHPLKGEVRISGSKNATLPIMAATLLAKGSSVLHNVPRLKDVEAMISVLEFIGARVKVEEDKLTIDTRSVTKPEAPYELVRRMRASFLVSGPLIARCGTAKIARPGGCAIGPRPIDEHLNAFRALGVAIEESHGYIIANGNPKGAEINLSERSVTATENILMASSLGEGETRVTNSALEPHVMDLANFLNSMGARIKMVDGNFIISSVKDLHPVEYTVVSDYLETGTFMIAVTLTHGDIFLRGAVADHSSAEMTKLRELGANITKDKAGIRVNSEVRTGPCVIRTSPFPGFPTDLQPQICSLLCLSNGTSVVEETMYEDRFNHVAELQRMGAHIKVEGRTIIIDGVERLEGAETMTSDIRCGASLILAGLAADGKTQVLRVYHVDRGYENIDRKLASLGAVISRVEQST